MTLFLGSLEGTLCVEKSWHSGFEEVTSLTAMNHARINKPRLFFHRTTEGHIKYVALSLHTALAEGYAVYEP